MAKQTLGGIIGGLIVLIALGTLPNDSVTDAPSAIQNAKESYAADVALDSSGQVINQLSEQSENNACKDPESQGCKTTKSNNALISMAFLIVVLAIIIDGLVGFTKWIIRSAEFISDLF